MNVLLVSREFPPFRGGGIGTYTEQAAHALADAGHRAVVLTVSHDGSASRSPHAADPRVPVVRLPLVVGDDWSRPAPAIDTPETRAMFGAMGPWSVLSRGVATALPALVREHDIDVVEAPECGALLWWTLNRRRIGRDAPRRADGAEPLYVVHLHSPNAWIDAENRQAAPRRPSLELRQAERESAQWADTVICPSHDLGAWASRHWDLPRVHTVPYPLGFLSPRDNPVHDASGPVRALLVGRLEPRKGVDIAFRALTIAGRRGVDARLALAGQDTRDARSGAWFAHRSLRAIVPPELADRVALLGKLDATGLADARRAANVALVPGAFDNFPYAAMESMSEGLPVIAPRSGGIAELVRDGVDGLLFEPHDPASLADAMTRFHGLSPAERRAMGSSAARRVASFCDNRAAISARERLFTSRVRTPAPPASDRALTPDAVSVGNDAPDLRRAVDRGRVDFAIGWPRTAGAAVEPFGSPSAAIRSLTTLPCPSIAVAPDLLARFVSQRGSGQDVAQEVAVDPDELLTWLIEQGCRGAVDPDADVGAAASSDPETRDPLPVLAMNVDAFRQTATLRMAGRDHPFPWPVVPLDGAAPASASVTTM